MKVIRIIAILSVFCGTVFIAVKEISFSPKFNEKMLISDYIKTIRIESMIPAAMNPDNKDIKF